MRIGGRMNNDDRDHSHYVEDSDDDDDESTTRSGSPDFVSYRSREQWADIEPISIKTQTSIMDIKYTARYEEAFSYFRAILARDELSERSLALTSDCIELQRSNFTVWYFRRRILRKLQHHLPLELAYVEKIIEQEPKNYQVWHHRKTIVEWLQDSSQDKQLTASVLAIDNKNYHAWEHRQWLIKHFLLWLGEIEFTDAQLAMDVRNNSAWNHRFFVIKETRRYEDQTWLNDEIQFVHKKIEQLPNNESSWSYLRGLLALANNSLTYHTNTRTFCDRLYTDKKCRSAHLLGFILDAIHEELTKPNERTQSELNALKIKGLDLCAILSDTDCVRSKYWSYIATKIKES